MNAQRRCTVCGEWTAPNNICTKCLEWTDCNVKAYALLKKARRVVAFLRFKAARQHAATEYARTPPPIAEVPGAEFWRHPDFGQTVKPEIRIHHLTAEEMDKAIVVVPGEVSGAEYARPPIILTNHEPITIDVEPGLYSIAELAEVARGAFIDELTATVEQRLEEIAR